MSRLVLPPGVQADGYDARSGLHLAAEAHAAGAVEPAGPPADTFDVSVTFTARGAAAEIRESVDRMTGHLALVGNVTNVSASIAERLPT